MNVTKAVSWGALVTAIVGGVIAAENRYASAGGMSDQKLLLTNKQEMLSNDNRLERYKRELAAIHRRRLNEQKYPGDAELIAEILEEIRISGEYRLKLREQSVGIK